MLYENILKTKLTEDIMRKINVKMVLVSLAMVAEEDDDDGDGNNDDSSSCFFFVVWESFDSQF